MTATDQLQPVPDDADARAGYDRTAAHRDFADLHRVLAAGRDIPAHLMGRCDEHVRAAARARAWRLLARPVDLD